MSKKILLISETQIKSQSIIESNVDPKVLSKVTWNVQEIQLKSILGSTLYNTTLNAVDVSITDGTPLDAATTELINDYIHPFLVHAVVSDMLMVNQYKLTNKGLLKMSDDVADAVSSGELESVKNYHDQYKNSYKANLVKYLQEKNLVESTDRADTNITVESIGWFLN